MLKFDSDYCQVMIKVIAKIQSEIHSSQAELKSLNWLKGLPKMVEVFSKLQFQSYAGKVILHGLLYATKAQHEGKTLDSYLMVKIVQEWAKSADVDVSAQIGELTLFNFSKEEQKHFRAVDKSVGFLAAHLLKDSCTHRDLEADFQNRFGRKVSAEIILLEGRFLVGYESLPDSFRYISPEQVQASQEILDKILPTDS